MAGLLSTQLNPTTSTGQFIGDALSGLGAGLLAYGGGGYLRPQAGMIGLQALQAAPQVRQERLMQNLQYQLGNQQLQQGGINNALNNASTLMILNLRRQHAGLPPITQTDLLTNPQQAFQGFSGAQGGVPPQTTLPSMGAPQSQTPPMTAPTSGVLSGAASGQPQPLPAGGMLKTGANYQMPSMPQQPSQMPAQTSVDNSADPYGFQSIINDAWILNPEKAPELEMQAAQNDPRFLVTKALSEKGLVLGRDGAYHNADGSVASQAQLAGAIAQAQAQGQLPTELSKIGYQGAVNRQNDRAKAAITPITITVPDGKGGFKQVNTNNLAASGGTDGLPVFTEMDKQMVPLLTANIGENQKAASGARDSLTQIGELRKALSGLPTGPGTEITNEAAAALQKAGIDINSLLPYGYQTDPTKYAVAMKNVNNLGMAVARSNFAQGGGRITNADLVMAIKTTPNLMNNPQANQILLNNMETIQRLKLDRSEFDNQWLKDHGGVPRLQMEQDWADKVKGMKNVPDDIKSAFFSFGDLAQNPNAPQTPGMNLPDWAKTYAIDPQSKHVIYYDGKAWVDQNRRPVQ